MSELKRRFIEQGYSVTKYARKCGVSASLLLDVLNGKQPKRGWQAAHKQRELVAQLARDGVWVGRLPWERDDDS